MKNLIFQSSPLLILLCLVAGLLYAWLLYPKRININQIWLSVLRALSISILCFLLLNFLIKKNKTITEKAQTLLIIDNSKSMNLSKDLKTQILALSQKLKDSGVAFSIETIDGSEEEIETIKFNKSQSDIAGLIDQAKENQAENHVAQAILLSDGIVNAGISTLYKDYLFKIHTIGVGDSTKKIDAKLGSVYANKLAYIGNKFPVQVDLSAFDLGGKTTTLLLKDGDAVLDRQTVNYTSSDYYESKTLMATATGKGYKKLVVELVPVNGEASLSNNKREVIVEVIDAKEKILVLGVSPHPDLKALKSILTATEKYEVNLQTVSGQDAIKIPEFDILILHQIPDLNGLSSSVSSQVLAKNKPVFFIVGAASNIPSLNGYQQVLGINTNGNQTDQVTGALNPSFKVFEIATNTSELLKTLGPLSVPFGDIRASAESQTILYQRVGNTQTSKPLLAINLLSPRKAAVLVGEGLWKWRLDEYVNTEKNETVDQLIVKTLQLLSSKDDNRKLRVDPTMRTFQKGEKVSLQVETYNAIMERIYDQQVSIEIVNIKGQKSQYSFSNAVGGSSFDVSGLSAGQYTYSATANISGKIEKSVGQFFVSDIDLESQNTQADFNLLRNLSKNNDGLFVKLNEIDKLISYLKENVPADKIANVEQISDASNLKWLFGLILFILAIEWAARKYLGY